MRAPNERTIAVIPARYASSRFPGKPLVDLDGTPMIVRVARRAAAARLIDEVLVATDDARIAEVVEHAGFRAVMTLPACATGGDRVAAALRQLDLDGVDLVLNVQGDEPLIDPADLDALIAATRAAGTDLGTLARPLTAPEQLRSAHVVKVVAALDGRALYFSRAPIPHAAGRDGDSLGAFLPLQHVGIYAYRPAALARLAALPRTPLELVESLEQLRALEHGLTIHVARCVSLTPTAAIDVPEDVERVLAILRSDPLRDSSPNFSQRLTNHGITD